MSNKKMFLNDGILEHDYSRSCVSEYITCNI